MTPDQDTSFLDRISPEESASLERQWNDGKLSHHHEQMLRFVQEQRAEILQLANDQTDAASLAVAAQKHIATLRSIHPPFEMHDQMREMHNEIWYGGQRGDYDTKRIAREWVARHGSNWRRWRIKEYIFVAGRCAAEIADIIHKP